MFVIDQITANFKALLRSSDTAIHFWTLNLIVATYTITDILMICKKTGDKKKKQKQEQQQLLSVFRLSVLSVCVCV